MSNIKIFLNTFMAQLGFNDYNTYLLVILFFALFFTFFYFIKILGRTLLLSLEKKFANNNFSIWLNLVDKLSFTIIIFNALFYASLFLPFNYHVDELIFKIYIVISIIFAIDVIRALITNIIKIYFNNRGDVTEEAVKNVINFARVVSTMILWLIAIIAFLQFSQIDTKALVSGLGIASIIVAFSFQKILGDIFAFFSIYIDKSFAVGDFIVFGKHSGTIKEIRIRTTKIKALTGQELIIANNQLINDPIENYTRLQKRRISFDFLLPNNLSKKQIENFIADFEALFTSEEFKSKAELSRIKFTEITHYGLNIKIIYYFNQKSFLAHLDFKEKVNLAILETLRAHKITLVQLPLIKTKN